MNDLLSRLGLHTQSIAVYRDIIEHGGSFLQEISKRTGLERMSIYRRIPELLEKHLIYREQVGKRYRYRAHPPDTLREMLDTLSLELDSTIG